MKSAILTALVAWWAWAGAPAAAPAAAAALSGREAGPEAGPFPVGFELIVTADASRAFPAAGGSGFRPRPMRVYVWYPARQGGGRPLTIGDFVAMAADDFSLSAATSRPDARKSRLPVPLRDGLGKEELQKLLKRPTASQENIPAAAGEFPLLVVGQGLYYESPLAQLRLCEHLASRGYVVASCPLLGTRCRLVNLTVEDLETQVRDMEFVVAELRSRPALKAVPLGIVGYDLGGHAGLVLAMRHPQVAAFLSLDAGILSPHSSGLPASHPGYREERFTIPWMHMTQARFLASARRGEGPGRLSDRKRFGDTWIAAVPSDSHGQFSSYATFGITAPVPGYWGPVAGDSEALHDGICRLAGDFFDAVLKKEARALASLQADAASGPIKIAYRKGAAPHPSPQALLHEICEKGLAAVRPEIDGIRTADPGAKVLEQSELYWLAYHFLLWWGREDEAIDLFQLNVDLNPRSADAHAGLGEACMMLGRTAEAIAAFRKALELNPDIPGVQAALERLKGGK